MTVQTGKTFPLRSTRQSRRLSEYRRCSISGMGSKCFCPTYSSIYIGSGGLADFINSLQFTPGAKLNVVAHSHGGNVVKVASYFISHPITNLVNLGTPQNWDLPGMNWLSVNNYSPGIFV